MSARARRARADELELERLRLPPRHEARAGDRASCRARPVGYVLDDDGRWRYVCETHREQAIEEGRRTAR